MISVAHWMSWRKPLSKRFLNLCCVDGLITSYVFMLWKCEWDKRWELSSLNPIFTKVFSHITLFERKFNMYVWCGKRVWLEFMCLCFRRKWTLHQLKLILTSVYSQNVDLIDESFFVSIKFISLFCPSFEINDHDEIFDELVNFEGYWWKWWKMIAQERVSYK